MAAAEQQETAGNDQYQDRHMNAIFQEGFSFSGYERDLLSWNLGGREFLDISGVSGVDHISDGRGSLFADLDNDGDMDIFLVAVQGDAHFLFRNNVGSEAAFLRLELRGRRSGPDAFGAVVRVKTAAGIQTQVRTGGSGFLSQMDPRLLFGLGAERQAEWIEVTWPGGEKQRWGGLAAGSYRIVEGQKTLERPRVPRGSPPDPSTEEEDLLALLSFGVGDPFPDVELRTLDGEARRVADVLRPDGRTFVNLWATFCIPCRKEMPELQSLASRFEEAGIRLVGVSLDLPDTVKKVPAFLDSVGVSYPNYTAHESSLSRIFAGDEVQIPMSFLLDAEGRVLQILPGWSASTQSTLHHLLGSDL